MGSRRSADARLRRLERSLLGPRAHRDFGDDGLQLVSIILPSPDGTTDPSVRSYTEEEARRFGRLHIPFRDDRDQDVPGPIHPTEAELAAMLESER